MQGQLIKRGDSTWLVRIPLGRSATGTRLYHNHTVKGTKKDAERYRTKTLRELDTGTLVDASPKPLGEHLSDWLSGSAANRVRSRTLADYRSLVQRYLVPALGHKKLAHLTANDIQRAYSCLQDKGLSARTIRYAHSVLHGALEVAVRWRLIAQNPAKLVDLPRQQSREMRSLSQDEASRFLAAVQGNRFEALWILLLSSGLRPGEALGLKWGDLGPDSLAVQRSLSRSGKQWELAEPKTVRARRHISLPKSTVRALQAHRARQSEDRLRAGPEWQTHDLIFCTHMGAPLEWRTVSRRYFAPVLRKAGLSRLRPYDLRHTCASLLLAAGENIKVVSERLGHVSSSLTLDTYSHVLPGMQQQAADKLEGMLFSAKVAP